MLLDNKWCRYEMRRIVPIIQLEPVNWKEVRYLSGIEKNVSMSKSDQEIPMLKSLIADLHSYSEWSTTVSHSFSSIDTSTWYLKLLKYTKDFFFHLYSSNSGITEYITSRREEKLNYLVINQIPANRYVSNGARPLRPWTFRHRTFWY